MGGATTAANSGAVSTLVKARRLYKTRQEAGRRDQVAASAELGPHPGQEIVEVSGQEAHELEHGGVVSAGEQQRHKHHAERRELGGDGDEVKVGLHPTLILGDGTAHGENQSRQEGSSAHEVGAECLCDISACSFGPKLYD